MFFKMPVEVGEILEAALVANFRDAVVAFHQETAGMADPDLGDIVGKCFPGMVFEIPGEGSDAHVEFLRDLFDVNFILIIL